MLPYRRFNTSISLVLVAFSSGSPIEHLLCCPLTAANLFRREHGGAAVGCGAETALVLVVGVVEVVLVGELFTGCDVAQGGDEDAVVGVLLRLAVGFATVVEEHGHAEAVDDGVASAGEEIGDGAALVTGVGDGLGHALAVVLADADSLADGTHGVASGGVDSGGTNDESGKHHAGLTITKERGEVCMKMA